ncbi:conserved hypothetical protein [Ricinus communis]|uniref:Uncharacterized protein n=1 Tax=Ricinus communis TaxID=3988 RepID=B9RJ12_RICCO|nr:conserved hypothetical protein [Ricinus communis]
MMLINASRSNNDKQIKEEMAALKAQENQPGAVPMALATPPIVHVKHVAYLVIEIRTRAKGKEKVRKANAYKFTALDDCLYIKQAEVFEFILTWRAKATKMVMRPIEKDLVMMILKGLNHLSSKLVRCLLKTFKDWYNSATQLEDAEYEQMKG